MPTPYSKSVYSRFIYRFLIVIAVIILAVLFTQQSCNASRKKTRDTKPVPKQKAVRVKLPSATEIYDRSLVADDLYSYSGHQVTTYWKSGRSIRVYITHLKPNWRRIDYLAPETYRGRSVVINGLDEWIFDSNKQTLHHIRRITGEGEPDYIASYEQLRNNYILSFLPETKSFADRKTYVLLVNRKSDHSIARKIWIDAVTGLFLKRELYGENGRLYVTVSFSDIDYHPKLWAQSFIMPGMVEGKAAGNIKIVEDTINPEEPVNIKNTQQVLNGKAITPQMVGGYQLFSASLVTNRNKKILHLRYFDGLQLISIFEQLRTHKERPTKLPSNMHPLKIGGQTVHLSHHQSLTALNWDTNELNITLMGEMSTARMVDFAKSFGIQ